MLDGLIVNLFGAKHHKKKNIRDLFFATKDRLSVSNVELIDLIVEKLIKHLKPIKSWFSMPDFPYAETWWWVHSSREISNEWLINCLSNLEKTVPSGKILEWEKGIKPST